MQTRLVFKICIVISISAILFMLVPHNVFKTTHAQSETPFLVSPFYGEKVVNSWFDHEYPNYGDNDSIVRYDGVRRTNTDKGTCLTDGIDLNCYDGHNGLDFAMNYEPVLAAADGYVTFAGWQPGYEHYRNYGLFINIRHQVNGDYYLTNYGHLSSVSVKQGEYVKAGQVIGTSGSNGGSSGPHLHFDVRVLISGEYRPVDPFGWQPVPNADFQNDPWQLYAVGGTYGARSWCMWKDGQFASYCNANANSQPLQELTALGEYTLDDNTPYFSKGVGGLFGHCGVNPPCTNWWESGVGIGSHTFRTIADGWAGNYLRVDNWAKWEWASFPKGTYDLYVWVPNTNLPYPDIDGNGDDDTYTWEAKYAVRDCSGFVFENRIVDEFVGMKPDGAGGFIRETNNPYEKWLNIGTYCFDGASYVYLTDVTGENRLTHCHEDDGNNGWCRLTADAIRFVKRGHLDYLPLVLKQPTPTSYITPTPTRTPTPNPAFQICEPNETVAQWGTTSTNNCSISSNTSSYYLYPANGASTDADVFRYGYYLSSSSPSVTITFYLESIPPGLPYRFEVYNAARQWVGNSQSLSNGTQIFSVIPGSINQYNYYYVRVYSEYEQMGPSGYSPTDTYQVRAEVVVGYSTNNAYPAP